MTRLLQEIIAQIIKEIIAIQMIIMVVVIIMVRKRGKRVKANLGQEQKRISLLTSMLELFHR